MAHSGKIFPLHFRRDFNLNVNTYQQGLPNVYILSFARNWGDPLPDPLAGTTFRCTPDQSPVPERLVWTSAAVHSAGHTFRARFELTLSGTKTVANRFILITDATLGLIWQLRSGPPDDTFSPFASFYLPTTYYWNPAYFHTAPAGYGATTKSEAYDGTAWPP